MEDSAQKARFYDLIIDRAKKELDACGSPTCGTASLIFRLIPELNINEDKRIADEIIQFLLLPHPQFAGKRNYEEWIAWIKKQCKQRSSTFEEKPTWKPTKEQMKALHFATKAWYLGMNEEKRALKLLYNDLKKLQEEQQEEQVVTDKFKPLYTIGDHIIPLNDELCEVVGICVPFPDRVIYSLKRMSDICGAIFEVDAHTIDSTATQVQRL